MELYSTVLTILDDFCVSNLKAYVELYIVGLNSNFFKKYENVLTILQFYNMSE